MTEYHHFSSSGGWHCWFSLQDWNQIMLWHLLLHFGVRLFMESDDAPVKQYDGVDYLKSDIQNLKDVLASGSRMRKQTPAEREASQTTFGYERFPLTEKERAEIARRIELLEELLCRAIAAKLK